MSAADRWVSDASEAHAVADWLQDSHRVDPVVVVSLPTGDSEPFFDLTALRRDVGSFAEIIVLPTGRVNLDFAERMPADAGVYGGGARVYPPVLAWAHGVSLAPLWITRSRGEAARQYPHVVRAVHSAVGPFHSTGTLPPSEAVAGYAVGDVVLAQVSRVEVASMEVDLYPGLTVEIQASDATLVSDEGLDDTFLAVQVIPVRILNDRPWRLSVTEAAGAASLLAPPLVRGGPPWIGLFRSPGDSPGPTPDAASAEPWRATPTAMHRPRRTPALPLPEPGKASPPLDAVVPRDSVEIVVLRNERDAAIAKTEVLTKELHTAEQRCVKASGEVQSLRSTLTEKSSELRQLRKRLESDDRPLKMPSGPELFTIREEAFRFDVCLSWATRVTAYDKENYPLPEFDIGPGFLASLGTIQGIDRAKIVDVCVEVLTGRAKEHSTHAPKPYRQSADPHRPQHRRPQDGALAYRVHVQNNSPAARRLHYWQLPDRRIELWSVAAHDDHTF